VRSHTPLQPPSCTALAYPCLTLLLALAPISPLRAWVLPAVLGSLFSIFTPTRNAFAPSPTRIVSKVRRPRNRIYSLLLLSLAPPVLCFALSAATTRYLVSEPPPLTLILHPIAESPPSCPVIMLSTPGLTPVRAITQLLAHHTPLSAITLHAHHGATPIHPNTPAHTLSSTLHLFYCGTHLDRTSPKRDGKATDDKQRTGRSPEQSNGSKHSRPVARNDESGAKPHETLSISFGSTRLTINPDKPLIEHPGIVALLSADTYLSHHGRSIQVQHTARDNDLHNNYRVDVVVRGRGGVGDEVPISPSVVVAAAAAAAVAGERDESAKQHIACPFPNCRTIVDMPVQLAAHCNKQHHNETVPAGSHGGFTCNRTLKNGKTCMHAAHNKGYKSTSPQASQTQNTAIKNSKQTHTGHLCAPPSPHPPALRSRSLPAPAAQPSLHQTSSYPTSTSTTPPAPLTSQHNS
jgi:hypothetical protein